MVVGRFYIIKDEFFEKFADPQLMYNKQESRPHYCAFRDGEDKDIYWMIPLTSKVEKYRSRAMKVERYNRHSRLFKMIMRKLFKFERPPEMFHIDTWHKDWESVFLVHKIFPMKDEFVRRAYMDDWFPCTLYDTALERELERKGKYMIELIKAGGNFGFYKADIMSIYNELRGNWD